MAAFAAMLAAATAAPAAPPRPSAEAAAAALFDRLAASPARLRVFLQAMPKGGDLHDHLGGDTYAEDYLAWADADGFCVAPATLAILPPPCKAPETLPARGLADRDPDLWSAMIDGLSTRGRAEGVGVDQVSGHDRFFATFTRFVPIAARSRARMLVAARRQAAGDAVSYLELMMNPDAVATLTKAAAARPFDPDDLATAYAGLAPDLPAMVADARAETDRAEADMRQTLGCGGTPAPPACAVEIRYLGYALRSLPPAAVFGQLTAAFAIAAADPRFVGVDIVAPEDGPVAMRDYGLHMRMFRFLAARYPGVKTSLHAGELTLGLVPPEGLRSHIADAVAIAGARRIGHGVDMPYEANAPALLARMAREGIAVEIALSSNATILGVRGPAHPIALYRAAGVPVVLATDDAGVARSDMTNEYLRAATEQGLRYRDLKQIARNSLEYAFLPGASLWAGAVGQRVPACRDGDAGTPPAGACGLLLGGSEKARAQWRLEASFARFERTIGTLPF